jgi:hypothetical protein
MTTPDDRVAPALDRLLAALGQTLIGQDELHRLVVAGFLSRGHILLEGMPGLGKTSLIAALGKLLGLSFDRVQFTPDLMPGDVLGTTILEEREDRSREFVFREGPIFTNILLADEINRASPKTQSALLEAMQERRVTVSGRTRPLPDPFVVLASQNPIELEGTYALPEAQLDRFCMKLFVKPPPAEVSNPSSAPAATATRRPTSPSPTTLRSRNSSPPSTPSPSRAPSPPTSPASPTPPTRPRPTQRPSFAAPSPTAPHHEPPSPSPRSPAASPSSRAAAPSASRTSPPSPPPSSATASSSPTRPASTPSPPTPSSTTSSPRSRRSPPACPAAWTSSKAGRPPVPDRHAVARLAALALTILLAAAAHAGQASFGRVSITIDESPARVVTNTGYFALPITIRNDAETDHDITLTLAANDQFESVVANRISTSLRVPANSTARTALYVPPASISTGIARVTINGVLQRDGVATGHIAHGPLLNTRWRGRSNTPFLVLASRQVNPALRDAYENHASGDPTYEGFEITRAERDTVDWIPDWLAYSRYAMVMVDSDDWLAATPAVRDALAAYARTGGVLSIVGTGVTPREVPGLTAPNAAVTSAGFTTTGFGYTSLTDDSTARQSRAEIMRLLRTAALARLNSFDLADAERTMRATPERTLPVGGILALLFLTAIIIGPVNLIALARMRRRAMLFLTTPVLGLTFAAAIFALGFLHDGIDARVTTRSLTVLDHAQNRATTVAHWGVYAPLPPSAGISIAPDTEVTPIGQGRLERDPRLLHPRPGPTPDLRRRHRPIPRPRPPHPPERHHPPRTHRHHPGEQRPLRHQRTRHRHHLAPPHRPRRRPLRRREHPRRCPRPAPPLHDERPPPHRPPPPARSLPLAIERFFNAAEDRDFVEVPANAYIAILAADPFIDVDLATGREPTRETIVIGLLEGAAP